MKNWLHVHAIRYDKRKRTWLMGAQRSCSSRPLFTSYNFNRVKMYATYFAAKHQLLLFIHDVVGNVIEQVDGKEMVAPSGDFKEYYNNDRANKVRSELPNFDQSTNVKDIKIRAHWKGSTTTDEPKWLVVHVIMHDGKKVKFKSDPYPFPSPELLAKIGLLL